MIFRWRDHFFSSFTSASYVESPELPELPEPDSVPELPPSVDYIHHNRCSMTEKAHAIIRKADAKALLKSGCPR